MADLEKLEWDSEFFGKQVFSLKSSSEQLIAKAIESLPNDSLLYIFSDKELNKYKDFLVDKKVTFNVSLSDIEVFPFPSDCILNSVKPFLKSDLELLAIESSVFSRFRVDPKIDNIKADDLYRKWINKAISDVSTFEIIGVEINAKLAGMNMIKQSTDCHQIELIAVSNEHHRKGIGNKLINACFANALKSKVSKVSVITQLDNVKACGLYESKGFKISNIKYIYHVHQP